MRLAGGPRAEAARVARTLAGDQAAALRAPTADHDRDARFVLAALLGDSSFRLTAFEVPEPYASIGAWRN